MFIVHLQEEVKKLRLAPLHPSFSKLLGQCKPQAKSALVFAVG